MLACGLPSPGVMAACNQLAAPPVTEVAALSWARLPVPLVLHQEGLRARRRSAGAALEGEARLRDKQVGTQSPHDELRFDRHRRRSVSHRDLPFVDALLQGGAARRFSSAVTAMRVDVACPWHRAAAGRSG